MSGFLLYNRYGQVSNEAEAVVFGQRATAFLVSTRPVITQSLLRVLTTEWVVW